MPSELNGAATIADLLTARAQASPDTGIAMHPEGEDDYVYHAYPELDARCSTVAAELAARFAPGTRAILVYPPGLEFIEAFFGAMRAGLIAVPVYPPSGASLPAWLYTTNRIIKDCAAGVVLSTSDFVDGKDALGIAFEPDHLEFIGTDAILDDELDSVRLPRVGTDDVAFIQYTSGSTGAPKGVVLRHRNLLANQKCIRAGFDTRPDDVFVSWLPLYHDMGLIGCVMHSMFYGCTTHLMSPLHFIQKPYRWLHLMSALGATFTGSPNFGYDLCVRKITEQQRAELDLSRWRVAFNGAEPIQPATLRRFVRTFRSQGFSGSAFLPCYGLAEATLLVTGKTRLTDPPTPRFERAALANGKVVPAPAAADVVELVSCGPPAPGVTLEIVDPDRAVPCADGTVGEIWLQGESVASGYFGANSPSEVFAATLPGRTGSFLRTGDLGFLHNGELFVAGRRKDLIIVRGLNFHPQDIEGCVQAADPRLRPGCGVAFQPADDTGIVVVQETTEIDETELARILLAIRQQLASHLQAPVEQVCLVGARTIPKTSSGKLRRSALADAYRAGELVVLTAFRQGSSEGIRSYG